jgi:hypothetical protein
MKSFLRKVWNFYWKGESVLSYAFFIIVTYLAFRFVLFPGFLLVTGLSDVVAIMSESMEHVGNEDAYYYQYFETNGYNRSVVDAFPYTTGLYVGDVLLVKETNNYSVGDVVIYYSPEFGNKIIHRIVSTDPIVTKGDNNPRSLFFEYNVTQIVGRPVLKIPFLGLPRWLLYKLVGI